jgi:hypothetical protein
MSRKIDDEKSYGYDLFTIFAPASLATITVRRGDSRASEAA